MPTILNNAEGQTSGTTVTSANSGGSSGNAFDFVVIGTNMTETFDNGHPAHGVNGYKIALTSTATAITYLEWTSTTWGATVTHVYGAFYFYLAASGIPSTIRLVDFMSGSTLNGRIGCNNTLAGFQFRNSADAVIGTVAGGISANTLYRVEFDVLHGASGAGTLNVYSGDSTSLLHTGGFTATSFGTNFDHIRFGCNTAAFSTTSGDAFVLDDLNVNDVGLPGPGPYGASPRGPIVVDTAVDQAANR